MIHLFPCLNDQEGICQHTADKISNDGDLADLYDWFNNEDLRSSPVLASMNLAGSMRAFTDVPMIIHPQSVDAFSKSLFFLQKAVVSCCAILCHQLVLVPGKPVRFYKLRALNGFDGYCRYW